MSLEAFGEQERGGICSLCQKLLQGEAEGLCLCSEPTFLRFRLSCFSVPFPTARCCCPAAPRRSRPRATTEMCSGRGWCSTWTRPSPVGCRWCGV